MKKYFAYLIVTFLVILSGCSNTGTTGEAKAGPKAEYVLRLGHLQTETHPYHKGALRFKELVEKESNGRIQIDIFPSSQFLSQSCLCLHN